MVPLFDAHLPSRELESHPDLRKIQLGFGMVQDVFFDRKSGSHMFFLYRVK